MKRMGYYWAVALLSILISCREPTLDSAWRSTSNTGEATTQYSSYILNGEDVVVALQNDDNNLYLRIKAANRAAQQKMLSGLTVWLDASGKKKKNFGIQYPLVQSRMMPPGQRPSGDMPSGERPPMGDRGDRGKPGGFEKPDKFPGFISGGRDSLLVLGPGKDERHVIAVNNQVGITASISEDQGPMIYDLTIPLNLSDEAPYAIGINAGGLISLGIETASAKPYSKDMRDGEKSKSGGDDSFGGGKGSPGGFGDGGDWGGDGDWGGGGSPPGGGGMGGGPGSGRGGPGGGPGGGKKGGSESINAEPLKFWARVRLASAERPL